MRAKLEHVRLTYDEGLTWALDDVSLEITPGERICIIGSNGSGKSTIAQLLCGLEAPDEGSVELAGQVVFDGQNVKAEAYREARHHTGLVFQNPEDQIVTSIVADDVAFGPENLGVCHAQIVERVAEELNRVALGDFAEMDPARLSGGQQQRLAIAGALAKRGDMLVLDEPGAMLDVRGRRGIMRVLDELQSAGVTLVHITHFMREAAKADRVIVMHKGHKLFEGTPEEVFAQEELLIEAGLQSATKRAAQEKTAPQNLKSLAASAASTAKATTPAGTVNAINTPALCLDNVSYAYGATPVLNSISCEIPRGCITALIGHTGSGKSTLARLICALDAPSSGSISVCGIDTCDKKRRRELRGSIGYVMQLPERQLFATSVFEDVAFGPRNLHLPEDEVKRRVEEQLASFNLLEKRDVSPFELSGGQQRLVALAGVLAMEPQILVLDEPTAGLDPAGAERIKARLRELALAGTTVLLITHSMDMAAELASYVIALTCGNIALQGTPEEVFAQAGTLHTIGLGIPGAKEVRPC